MATLLALTPKVVTFDLLMLGPWLLDFARYWHSGYFIQSDALVLLLFIQLIQYHSHVLSGYQLQNYGLDLAHHKNFRQILFVQPL